MERKMRRFRQLLSEDRSKEILSKASHGVLSLVDPDGSPYGVPINFAYDGNYCIYLHSAMQGYKIDCIEAENRCSFCVVEQDLIVPEEFTSYFRSVIARGTIHKLTSPEEINKGLLLLCDKYSPEVNPDAEIARCLNRVVVLRMDIEFLTGKEAIELVRQRRE